MDTDKLSLRLTEIKDALEDQPTLRDRFAMAALTGICAAMPREDVFDIWKGIKGGAIEAKAAYELADKMLQARKEKG